MPVHRLRAVVSDPDGDALRVDELPDIMRVHAVDVERHRADPVPVLARPQDAHAVDVAKPEQFGSHLMLVRGDGVHTDRHHPLRGRTGGHHLRDRLGAGLEFGGRRHVLRRTVHPSQFDHRAAEIRRGQRLQQFAATV